MSGFKFQDHNDRRDVANKARQAALERFKNRIGPGHPEFERLQAERVRLAAEREERQRTAKEEKIRREAEAKAAAAAAEENRLKAERTAYLAKMAADKETLAQPEGHSRRPLCGAQGARQNGCSLIESDNEYRNTRMPLASGFFVRGLRRRMVQLSARIESRALYGR